VGEVEKVRWERKRVFKARGRALFYLAEIALRGEDEFSRTRAVVLFGSAATGVTRAGFSTTDWAKSKRNAG
jgi:hypothetical protein